MSTVMAHLDVTASATQHPGVRFLTHSQLIDNMSTSNGSLMQNMSPADKIPGSYPGRYTSQVILAMLSCNIKKGGGIDNE